MEEMNENYLEKWTVDIRAKKGKKLEYLDFRVWSVL